MKWFRAIVVPVLLVGGCLATQYAMHQRVVPTGRGETLRGYLAWRPTADRFASVVVGGKPHVIAYGSKNSLMLSSGPAAYVFDDTGRLVDWSRDIGDDPAFDERWSAQRLRAPGRSIARDQAVSIATTQSAQE